MMTHATNIIIQHLLGSVLVFSLYAVAADPPDRPPGHGHREQHHQEREEGDHGERGGRAQVIIEPRYGVLHDRRNREALSGALGGVAGNQISSGEPAGPETGGEFRERRTPARRCNRIRSLLRGAEFIRALIWPSPGHALWNECPNKFGPTVDRTYRVKLAGLFLKTNPAG